MMLPTLIREASFFGKMTGSIVHYSVILHGNIYPLIFPSTW